MSFHQGDPPEPNRAGPKMGWNSTWSMAVGGMVGGGIFSVFGLVVALAGPLAWLSFLLAGLVALAAASCYVRLARLLGEGGGAFTFLRAEGLTQFAASLSWVLIAGYVLTMAVYAFTFGHYLGEVIGLGGWFARMAAAVILAAVVGVNLLGVGEAAGLEVFTVWGKLAILAGLAAIGIARWEPARLSAGLEGGGLGGAIVGAASIFMAYEGFQLLTYDYEEIRDPERTLSQAVIAAVLVVIVLYIAVALGAAMLVGGRTLVEQKEVALAAAGEAALGGPGKVIVSVGAVFSTASAINATLFATARLVGRLAHDGELPRRAGHHNVRGVPDRAIVALGALAAALATLGSLSTLVEAASLTFLFTFATVGVIGARELGSARWIGWAAAAGAAVAGAVLAVRLATTQPWALVGLAALVLAATAARPAMIRRTRGPEAPQPACDEPRSGSTP